MLTFFMDPPYLDAADPPSKQAILRASIKLFAQNGVSATNVRAISKESGYTNPAIFKFFESKDALALHLFERCYLSLARQLTEALAGKRPFALKLQDVLTRVCRFAHSQPAEFFFVQDNLRAFWPKLSAQSRRTSVIGGVRLLLKQGIQQGAVNPRADLNLLVAMMSGTLLQFLRMRSLGEFRGTSEHWVAKLHELLCKAVAT